MLFSSPFFIFIFLPLFFASYYLLPWRFRDYMLLAGSLGFYFWGEPLFCIIAIVSAVIDHQLCQLIYRSGVKNKKSRQYVAIGIIINLLILFYFKYTNFFLNTLTQLVSGGKYHFELFDIILPIGVSFIVFEKITYLVDVYSGTGQPAKGLHRYLSYVFLFPKLLAGPIIKYHEIESQLHHRKLTFDTAMQGFARFLRGLAKKVFIADLCGSITNKVFALNADGLNTYYAWLGILCFTLQIYFDFSGYSDMALGLARMAGFELKENFNMPYISKSFTEFWRRWHISLSTWIREYLYIPLGGSHISKIRTYINLWTCFLLSGLWHGANWNFILWGAYNGIFLVFDKLGWLKLSSYLPQIIRTTLTLFLIMIGWVIFRSADYQQITYYLHALFTPVKTTNSSAYIDITSDIIFTMALGYLLILIPLMPKFERLSFRYQAWTLRGYVENTLLGIIGFLAICKVVGATYIPFLYFKF